MQLFRNVEQSTRTLVKNPWADLEQYNKGYMALGLMSDKILSFDGRPDYIRGNDSIADWYCTKQQLLRNAEQSTRTLVKNSWANLEQYNKGHMALGLMSDKILSFDGWPDVHPKTALYHAPRKKLVRSRTLRVKGPTLVYEIQDR